MLLRQRAEGDDTSRSDGGYAGNGGIALRRQARNATVVDGVAVIYGAKPTLSGRREAIGDNGHDT